MTAPAPLTYLEDKTLTTALLPRQLPGSTEVPPISLPARTDDEPEQSVDPAVAALALQIAVDQLTKPSIVRLNRSEPERGSAEWQQIADDRELEQASWNHLSEAYRLRDTAVARDALDVIDLIGRRRAARTVPTVEVPALLAQLQDAIPNGGDSGHSSPGTGASRSPLALAALDFVSDLVEATGFRGQATSPGLTAHVDAWCAKACGDDTQVARAAAAAADWPDRARAVLDPAKHWTIPGACPDCGRTTAYVVQDGDTVRRPTLSLDMTSDPQKARCLQCPARWVGEAQLHQLDRVLRAARTAEAPSSGDPAAGYRVDPDTLHLVERQAGDDRGPVCPVCKASVEVELIDTTSWAGGAGQMLGRWRCPNTCNPRPTS